MREKLIRWIRGVWFDIVCHKYKAEAIRTCCCGDDMERHGDLYSCGHSPVSQWDYTRRRYIEGK